MWVWNQRSPLGRSQKCRDHSPLSCEEGREGEGEWREKGSRGSQKRGQYPTVSITYS